MFNLTLAQCKRSPESVDQRCGFPPWHCQRLLQSDELALEPGGEQLQPWLLGAASMVMTRPLVGSGGRR